MTAPSQTITDYHWSLLEQLEAGDQPVIPAMPRRKLRRLKLIVETSPPRTPAPDGARRGPLPRQHALTELGRERLAEHRKAITEQTRHDVAASVARHAASPSQIQCDWHPEHGADDRPTGQRCTAPATHRITWLDGSNRYSYGCGSHLEIDREAPPHRIEMIE